MDGPRDPRVIQTKLAPDCDEIEKQVYIYRLRELSSMITMQLRQSYQELQQ